jgi:hypothetical protein
MTNNKSKPVGHKPGGGVNSNKAHNSKWRAKSAPNRAINPGYAAQLGTHVGEARAVEKIGNGKALSPPLGNELAAKAQCRPGGSRTIYPSGYESLAHGGASPAKPFPVMKDKGA